MKSGCVDCINITGPDGAISLNNNHNHNNNKG